MAALEQGAPNQKKHHYFSGKRPSTLLLLSSGSIVLQLILRIWIEKRFSLPINYWWLMGIGGFLIAAIAPTSIWRTLTGLGWTWKGRKLL